MENILKHSIKRIKEGILKDILSSTIWIYQYIKKYWKFIILYTFIGLTETAASLASGLVSKDLIDIITQHQTGKVIGVFAFFVGFSLATIVLSQISGFVSSWINLKVENEIKADIFDKILKTDWEAITAYHTGDLLTRWNSDVSSISNGILSWVPSLIIYTIKFISALGIMIYYDPSFALISLIGTPISIIMSRSLLRRMQSNNKQSAAINAKMNGFNQETFSNIQTIKAFDLIKLYGEYLRKLQKEYITMKLNFQKMSIKTSIILSSVGILVSYSCYGWGIYRVWAGSITYGTMTLFLSLSGTMIGTLNALISLVPTAISITTSVGRLRDILDMPKEDYADTSLVDEFSHRNRHHGISIKLKAVDYTYHTGTKVFRGIDFEADPNEIVALVGPSGEGKTTFLRILLSLLRPQNGNCILYGPDKEDSIQISPAARKLFSYVPQGNTMFSGTIAENMRHVKPSATDNEIIDALKTACAYDFVKKLPDGIHSMIGERGGGFSEGQSQRLSIARALLRKSPILLLDEATSALDVSTERKLLRNIMESKYPRTCIVTTHRPTVLSMCNKVYQLRNLNCNLLNEDEIDRLLSDF